MSPSGVRHAADIPWQASPGGEVGRKRFRLEGAEESGRVSSLVRYPPGTHFPDHAHPEGEEILVLEGVFSDHTGDYPAGTHLLNPEGHVHAPFSEPGCLLFVRLRQYAGFSRPRQVLCTDQLHWQSCGPGEEQLRLHHDAASGEVRYLRRAQAGTRLAVAALAGELFVVSGRWQLDGQPLETHDWAGLNGSAETSLQAVTDGTIYLHTAGARK